MESYNPQKIEDKWRKRWLAENRWQADLEGAKKPYYNLMMFPYPSAEGLHVGNLYAFTGSDIHGRYMRMRGYDVFEPIGFDAFGIHSENFAIKKGTHPRELIKKSTENFRAQLERAGNIYSWDNLVDTTDPGYYRWTQWLFLQLYKARLAYLKEAPVQWCPSCKTVLANEQVIAGKCERCDAVVESKRLKQWFFKITDYADRLLENLAKIDWSERTKVAQANWIGRSFGWRVEFPIKFSAANGESLIADSKKAISDKQSAIGKVEVFTTRPDTLFGATYLVLSPEHPFVLEQIPNPKSQIPNKSEIKKYINKAKNKTEIERTAEDREKTGVELKGIKAINPANGEEIPVWIADYVLAEYGTGAIMAVPAHDQRDFEFASRYNLPMKEVIQSFSNSSEKQQAYEGEGTLINSGQFDGMSSEEAKEAIGEFVEGDAEAHYHLRDWLISRQRYWGPPIPVIYCRSCRKSQIPNPKSQINPLPAGRHGNDQSTKNQTKPEEGIDYTTIDGEEYAIVPVPEEDLPVELPYVEDYKPKGTGKGPLANVEEFVNTKCPRCGNGAVRETDVSDTFLDSSWYFLRYPLVTQINADKKADKRERKPWDDAITKKWLPVDMYIGGQEHAVLHLMYARFITMVLYDRGLLSFEEPFEKFRAHGLLIREGAKISKSRGNTINPDEFFDAFGVDTVRTYLMFLSPLADGGDWRDEGIRGVHRFLSRVWGLVSKLQITNPLPAGRHGNDQSTNSQQNLEQKRHQTIKKVTEDVERLHYNTAIAALMSYLNALEKAFTRTATNNKSQDTDSSEQEGFYEHIKTLLILLAPFAPYITEELWEKMHNNTNTRSPAGGETNTNAANSKPEIYSSVHDQPWPEHEEEKAKEDAITIPVQINGKVKGEIEVEPGTSKEALEKAAFENVKDSLEGKEPKKIIVVPDKIVNIVF